MTIFISSTSILRAAIGQIYPCINLFLLPPMVYDDLAINSMDAKQLLSRMVLYTALTNGYTEQE